MNRIISFLILFLFISCDDTHTEEGENQQIPAENSLNDRFDAGFLKFCLEEFDLDGDGILTQEEIDKVTEIVIEGENIASLRGIGLFTNLKEFFFNDTKVSEVDLSTNLNLEWLDCGDNLLGRLDLSKNSKLLYLWCGGNEIKTLILPDSKILTDIYCHSNEITTLDVTNLPSLKNLHCYDNNLPDLELSKNTALSSLYCEGNPFEELNISCNKNLTFLKCYSQYLAKLYVWEGFFESLLAYGNFHENTQIIEVE